MIEWPAVLFFVYLGAIVIGLVLSFTTHSQPWRRYIRIFTWVLAAPLLLVLALLIFLRLTIFRPPPTLAELQRDFPSKRADLETIVRMSDEDVIFPRIAPGWYSSWKDPNAEMARSRLDAYRTIFDRNDIETGVLRDTSNNVFIMVDSVGLLNRGHTTGYVHCAPTITEPSTSGFYPCVLHQERGERKFNAKPREEAYSFQNLDNEWYAYDEGPS